MVGNGGCIGEGGKVRASDMNKRFSVIQDGLYAVAE